MELGKCIICKNNFVRNSGSQTICSKNCRKVRLAYYNHKYYKYKNKIRINCTECGKEHYTFSLQTRFCSKKCCDKNYAKIHKIKLAKKSKIYRKQNNHKIKLTQKQYYKENKEYLKERSNQYYNNNKFKCLQQHKIYYNNNKKYLYDQSLLWRKKNKNKYNKWAREYMKNREKHDIPFKFINRIRHRVYMICKAKNAKKNFKFKEYIGCSTAELMMHLEKQFKPGMTWNNYGFGDNKWNIDHIKPCAVFNKSDLNWQLKCFHYTNLQPLWQPDNFKKGDTYYG
jgi:hypothetical protein